MASRPPSGKIDDIELWNLSRRIGPPYYHILGYNLGYQPAELEHIKGNCRFDTLEATYTILSRWKDRQPSAANDRTNLSDILDTTELKAQGDLLREANEALFQQSARPLGASETSLSIGQPQPRDSTRVALQLPPVSQPRTPQPANSPFRGNFINFIGNMLPGLPQHQTHIYNATDRGVSRLGVKFKVILTTSNGTQFSRVITPGSHCAGIPTPWGRVRLAVYVELEGRKGEFEIEPAATFADDSDRSFIVRHSNNGKNLIIVRSVYGHLREEDTG